MMGIDIRTVQELMGHKSIEMTLRYTHLSLSYKKHAVDVLGKQLGIFKTPELKQEEISEVSDTAKYINNRDLNSSAPVAQKDRASVS